MIALFSSTESINQSQKKKNVNTSHQFLTSFFNLTFLQETLQSHIHYALIFFNSFVSVFVHIVICIIALISP